LQALPDGERAVLELVSVDGFTVAEAAAALGIRPVTARVRLHRARRALRSTSLQLVIETEVMT
jgi:RNA polymerase sigma-70 factor (ECF subfamily)